MLKDNLFQKIIDKQIPASIVYEDDRCLAFRDINPQAPTHVLIIPRKVIPTHDELTEGDRDLIGHLHCVNAFVSDEQKTPAELKHLADRRGVIGVVQRKLSAIVARMSRSGGHGRQPSG